MRAAVAKPPPVEDTPDASGGLDAIITTPSYMSYMDQAGKLLDLSKLVDSDLQLKWFQIDNHLRSQMVVYNSKVVAIPVTTSPQFLFYHLPTFERDGLQVPATWDQAIALAEQYHGKDINGDGQPDYGFCMTPPNCFVDGTLMHSILASFVQTRGPTQGVFLDPESMANLANSSAVDETLKIMRRLRLVGPLFGDCSVFEDALYLRGRCLLSLTSPITFKTAYSPDAPPAYAAMRGRMGIAAVPGSTRVLDRPTGRLVDCDADVCPLARATAPDANGVVRPVNQPVPSTNIIVMINAQSPPKYQFYAYSLFSYLTSPEVLGTQGDALLLDPRLETAPLRSIDMTDQSAALWVARGYDPSDVARFFMAYRAALASPNQAYEPRFAGNLNISLAATLAALVFTNATPGYQPPPVSIPTAMISRLWEHLDSVVMDHALSIHHVVMRSAILEWGGYESATEGDSFIVAFPNPTAALNCALAAQQAAEPRPRPPSASRGREVAVDVRKGSWPPSAAGDAQAAPHARVPSDTVRHPDSGPHSALSQRQLQPPALSRTRTTPSGDATPDDPPDSGLRDSLDSGGPSSVSDPRRVTPSGSYQVVASEGTPEETLGGQSAKSLLVEPRPSVPAGGVEEATQSSRRILLSAAAPATISAVNATAAMAGSRVPSSAHIAEEPQPHHPPAHELSSPPAARSAQPLQSPAQAASAAGGSSAAPALPPDAVLILRGLRVRMGMWTGVASAADVTVNARSGRNQYSGNCIRFAKAVSDTANGGMVVLTEASRSRLDPAAVRAARHVLLYGGLHSVDVGSISGASLPQLHLYLAYGKALLPRALVLKPLRSKGELRPGALAAPVSGHGTVVQMRVVGISTLMSWNADVTGLALTRLHTAVLRLLAAFAAASAGGAPYVACGQVSLLPPDAPGGASGGGAGASGGAMAVVFADAETAVSWAAAVRRAALELEWPPDLLEHELAEEVWASTPANAGFGDCFQSPGGQQQQQSQGPAGSGPSDPNLMGPSGSRSSAQSSGTAQARFAAGKPRNFSFIGPKRSRFSSGVLAAMSPVGGAPGHRPVGGAGGSDASATGSRPPRLETQSSRGNMAPLRSKTLAASPPSPFVTVGVATAAAVTTDGEGSSATAPQPRLLDSPPLRPPVDRVRSGPTQQSASAAAAGAGTGTGGGVPLRVSAGGTVTVLVDPAGLAAAAGIRDGGPRAGVLTAGGARDGSRVGAQASAYVPDGEAAGLPSTSFSIGDAAHVLSEVETAEGAEAAGDVERSTGGAAPRSPPSRAPSAASPLRAVVAAATASPAAGLLVAPPATHAGSGSFQAPPPPPLSSGALAPSPLPSPRGRPPRRAPSELPQLSETVDQPSPSDSGPWDVLRDWAGTGLRGPSNRTIDPGAPPVFSRRTAEAVSFATVSDAGLVVRLLYRGLRLRWGVARGPLKGSLAAGDVSGQICTTMEVARAVPAALAAELTILEKP
ncbi:hypothetical protein GPECTOR_13g831 [Gonium pectorale]|uniref:Guanylate cyclase domain-containing protein n=1 Tax=Gonium pectorale TaxID=33097 RepID=A0A150GNC4_GONPE|nr:hypothetical protein GPECTOR_13g831 [Gonium pectorale]|eukprot:KXZ51343.1 hypothetical protein GPECTOR_13g831 [Gonium pectorale]